MERPGFCVGTDAPILHRGHLSCRIRMHHTLRVPIEERQVERLVDLRGPIIGGERTYALKDVLSPGPSVHRREDTGVCAYHPKMSKQAEAAQNPSCDDHQHQSNQQCCTASRETPGLPL